MDVVRQAWRAYAEGGLEAELAFHPLEFIVAGGGFVLVPVATTLRGKGSRVPIESGHTWVYEVRDGKIVGDRAFRTKAEALEAVGPRE